MSAPYRYPVAIQHRGNVVHVGTVTAEGPQEGLEQVLKAPPIKLDPHGWYRITVGDPKVPQGIAVASVAGDELERTAAASGKDGPADRALVAAEGVRSRQEALEAAVDLLKGMGPDFLKEARRYTELEGQSNGYPCKRVWTPGVRELDRLERAKSGNAVARPAPAAGTGTGTSCRHRRIRPVLRNCPNPWRPQDPVDALKPLDLGKQCVDCGATLK